MDQQQIANVQALRRRYWMEHRDGPELNGQMQCAELSQEEIHDVWLLSRGESNILRANDAVCRMRASVLAKRK